MEMCICNVYCVLCPVVFLEPGNVQGLVVGSSACVSNQFLPPYYHTDSGLHSYLYINNLSVLHCEHGVPVRILTSS